MPISQISQKYDEILAEYRGMMQTIRRNEEISAKLACEIQKELFRMSEICGQDDGLKEVYKNLQKKEEIVNISTQNFDSANISTSKRHSLKETIKNASNVLQEISSAFQELNSTEDKIIE